MRLRLHTFHRAVDVVCHRISFIPTLHQLKLYYTANLVPSISRKLKPAYNRLVLPAGEVVVPMILNVESLIFILNPEIVNDVALVTVEL
jgi:hypothetical protein